ncbi:ATP-grasp fold amidoligase family protein [Virgibacillus senegalensis]|uniref:ATP-grasp fold amidoligase family protein n=1 Tax=Virgibacillus senegalensis TaxID=1499679 RepID=UPI00069DC1C4|nr:ATP-grasp fold amidoligase family protein [Virgibacillus senegalensis]
MLKKKLLRKFPIFYKIYQEFQLLKCRYYGSLNENEYPEKLAQIYKKKTGKVLDWNNLQTYNEKMQWAKLYENNPLKTTLADKYLVREWVKDTIGKEYLIPLLGVWDSFDEINFDNLPKKFVLKTNHGSGTNIIVKDKNHLDKSEAKKRLDKWLKMNFAYKNGFQMQYKNIKPKIIAEEYIEGINGDLNDYKFLCFDGKVYYCWIDSGRYSDHRRNIYNLNWELQEWQQHYYKNTDNQVTKPENFELMIELSKKLCQGFSHVRVDLYNVNGKVYFGEMTFTNSSGFEAIRPHKYNLMLGDLWNLQTGVYEKR